jgi:CubicO group peptidase (beta-lactamase class C family)
VGEPEVGTLGDVGMYTTARELAEWGRQYWEPTVGGDDFLAQRTPFMVPAALGEPVTREGPPVAPNSAYFAGIIADVDEQDSALSVQSVPGDHLGFTSELLAFPEEQLAAAVLCNHLGHDAKGIASALLHEYRAAR